MNKRFYIYTLLISTIFIFASCSSDDSPVSNPAVWSSNKVSYNVTYTEKTVLVDSAEVNNLIYSDSVHGIYRFNKTYTKAANLKKGDILLIYGKALKKVVSVANSSNYTEVKTEYATLNEAIKTGKISWDIGCDFKKSAAGSTTVLFKGQEYAPRILGDVLEWDFFYGGYSYYISMKLNDDQGDVKFQITKKLSDQVKGKFIAEGTVKRFRSKSELSFDNSKLSQFDQENSGLEGDLKLSLAVTASGSDKLNAEIPIILLKYPVMVGPIPVLVTVKAVVVVNAVCPLDGSSQVTAKFKYNSTTGFKYDGYNFTANGNIGPYTIDKDIAQTGASSPVGVNFGIGFPRLEASLFGEVITPWIQTAFLIGGDFTMQPPCQQAKASFIGGCGVDFEFLGFKKSLEKNLWQMDKVLLKSGDCPD